MTASYRVLVTGSRDWQDDGLIGKQLTALLTATAFVGDTLVLVHGACPTGADAQADAWGEWHRSNGASVEIERHPAQWRVNGRLDRRAGPARNLAMVRLGADCCLAFIGPCTSPRCGHILPHGSHGASGCATLAEATGIPTRRWTA